MFFLYIIYISVAMMSAGPRDVVIDMGGGMPIISRQVHWIDLKDQFCFYNK